MKYFIAMMVLFSVSASASESAVSSVNEECTYNVLASNVGPELDFAERLMKRAGYHFQTDSMNTLFFTSSSTEFREANEIRNQTYVILVKYSGQAGDPLTVFEGTGGQYNHRNLFGTYGNTWKRAVKEAFWNFPKCLKTHS